MLYMPLDVSKVSSFMELSCGDIMNVCILTTRDTVFYLSHQQLPSRLANTYISFHNQSISLL